MEKFLAKTRSRLCSLTRGTLEDGAAAETAKMAAASLSTAHSAPAATPAIEEVEDTDQVMPQHRASRSPQPSLTRSPQRPPAIEQDTTIDYQRIAQEVARILKPTIRDAVEQAIQTSLAQTRTNIKAHEGRIEEAEQRIITLEE